eukprot:scpid105988/ scgid34814/ 
MHLTRKPSSKMREQLQQENTLIGLPLPQSTALAVQIEAKSLRFDVQQHSPPRQQHARRKRKRFTNGISFPQQMTSQHLKAAIQDKVEKNDLLEGEECEGCVLVKQNINNNGIVSET